MTIRWDQWLKMGAFWDLRSQGCSNGILSCLISYTMRYRFVQFRKCCSLLHLLFPSSLQDKTSIPADPPPCISHVCCCFWFQLLPFFLTSWQPLNPFPLSLLFTWTAHSVQSCHINYPNVPTQLCHACAQKLSHLPPAFGKSVLTPPASSQDSPNLHQISFPNVFSLYSAHSNVLTKGDCDPTGLSYHEYVPWFKPFGSTGFLPLPLCTSIY